MRTYSDVVNSLYQKKFKNTPKPVWQKMNLIPLLVNAICNNWSYVNNLPASYEYPSLSSL